MIGTIGAYDYDPKNDRIEIGMAQKEKKPGLSTGKEKLVTYI